MAPKKTKATKKKHPETNGSSKPKPVADSATEYPEPKSNDTSKPKDEPGDTETDPIVEADRLKEKGNESFKVKRYGEAIDFYTRAIELRPTEPTYLTNRAACHMALKMFRPALKDCQAAANLQSSSPSPKTLVRLAKCHLALGSPNPALSSVREALAIKNNDTAAKDVERSALNMDMHLSRFLTARSNREWGLARLALDQAARECEGSEPIEWRCWRVEMELAKGKLEQATLAANDAFQIDRMSPEVLFLRGLVMFVSSKLPSAIQHLQQALSLDPENSRARKLLRRIKDVERIKEEGNAMFKLGDMAGAIEKYTEALGVVGEEEEEARGGSIRATLLSNRATSFLKLDQRSEALADTNMSLKLVPTSYKALRTRARINMATEDYQAAVNDFKAALEHVRVDGSQTEERALKQELKEAEIALKRSKTKDYYKILELPRNCSDSEIKKAYRKQSLLHHPDKGGDEEKFKLASEAYNILSDPQKRARYDAGEDDNDLSGMGMDGMSAADFADIFSSFGGGGGFNFGTFGGNTRFQTSSHGFP